ncbi:MAG: agmatine deiminase family protein [Marinilabiliaceae bacterium]|nr:agmatine deiminase family protein [Marinilabiliaceae bacterium]
MNTDMNTNKVYFSALLSERCPLLNGCIVEALQNYGIKYAYLSGTKDIWCRDFMPIQLDKNHFVSYRYTPNYLQTKTNIDYQTNIEDVFTMDDKHLQKIKAHCTAMDLVVDGGNVVKCGDKIVMTDKVFVENKDKQHDEVERILRETFQCDVLFLPWDKSERYGHSDGIVHYIDDGKILLTNYDDFSINYYNKFRKVLDEHFEVITLKYKVKETHEDSWVYINYLQVGTLVLVPQLGIEEDEQALAQISEVMPNCKVIGIPALKAIKEGGALNCISWNVEL